MNRLQCLIPVVLILALPPVMLYPLWGNPVSAGEDDIVFYYPLRKMVGQAIREGRWPAENPYEATGVPLMADPQSAVLHPPMWLFAVMDAKLAYALSIFLAFSAAGGGAYLYLRRLGLVRTAATFGGVAFMFCGFMVGHRVHLSIIQGAAMLPWGLWCLEALRTRPRAAFTFLTPVVFLALTAGHWPTFIHTSLIWAAYFLLRCRPLARSAAVAGGAAALALLLAWPQLAATADLLRQTTRQEIGYAVAGENSFHPAAAVLAMFPMLMGSRTPNFFPQQWWGPWHLCEMLGYAGLVTLVLAGAVVRRLYRKPRCSRGGNGVSYPDEMPTEGIPWASSKASETARRSFTPIVRVWTWIAVGAGLWMLGYYLPTYRLVHALPVLGVMRCPARMVVAVDMALAFLSAVMIHVMMGTEKAHEPRPAYPQEPGRSVGAGPEPADPGALLARTLRRGATRVLPIAMVATLALLAVAAAAGAFFWPWGRGPFAGGADDALRAVIPTNPAVWAPLALCAATAGVVLFWLKSPRRRAGVLVGLLLVDLFFLTRFVDVPKAGVVAPDPQVSPAAEWLTAHAPKDHPFRVWGLARDYHNRPAELLLPKTCAAFGIASIANYGPWQSPAHAHLWGFRITGENRDWARLIRRNHLLSLYNVRYVLAADPVFRDVIESVRAPTAAPSTQPAGDRNTPNVLSDQWELQRAELREGVLNLRTPFQWLWSLARQRVQLVPESVYRISLLARAPEGAADFLRAELFRLPPGGGWFTADELGLTVFPEQIGPEWRRFEWTFRAPRDLSGEVHFRVFSAGERTIEVKDLCLRPSRWEEPFGPPHHGLPGGAAVYRPVAELPALNGGEANVVIYENLLCAPAEVDSRRWSDEQTEALKWAPQWRKPGEPAVPNVGLAVAFDRSWVWGRTLPAGALYLLIVAALLLRRSRRSPA